jgi:hypothetical protein
MDNGGKPQTNGKELWQTPDHRENPVCTFYLPFLWGFIPEAKNGQAICLICSR